MVKTDEIPDIQEWFGFKKKEYGVDPHDANFIAFNEDFIKDLTRRSERYLISGIGPKFVVLELRGDGKTHAINYVMNKLQERKLIAKIDFDCPSMTSGSRYTVLHSKIIEKLKDAEILLPVFEEIYKEYSSGDVEKRIEQITKKIGFEDLAKAITMHESGDISDEDFLQYLMAEKISKTLQKEMGVVGSLDVEKAVRILAIVSEHYYKKSGKIIVLIIDESDELNVIRQAVREFKEFFRRLAEVQSLGFSIIYNIASEEERKFETLPAGLRDPGVVSRIGSDNYLFKPVPMSPQSILPLIIATNKYMRGHNFEEAFAKAKKENPDLDKSLYPFSKDGIEELEKKIQEFVIVSKKGEYLLPRDVIRFARECITDATMEKKRYVGSSTVHKFDYTQTYSR